ncbi:DUF124-domain-containing protein [Amylocystis lapponica]|nr:DUF124-domain-containing protein [Amylocystis lapponica]
MSYPQPGYPGQAPYGSYPPPGGPIPSQSPAPPAAGPTNLTGAFEGGQFKIGHRDSNTVLYLRLQPGAEVLTKPGTLVAMDSSVQIKGKVNFSFKKMLTGGELAFAHFFGPGEVMVSPDVWGDIASIRLDGSVPWFFGKHAHLASTPGITLNTKAQSFGKMIFSGHGLFTGTATGQGTLFVQALGAIISRDLQPGEQWVVNNDHLVAWNCQYNMEKIQAGGIISSIKTDEGAVCRFTGPGTVYIQTRSADHFISWIHDRLPDNN